MISSYILITLILVAGVTGQRSICTSLQWITGYRRKIFTAIMNHADCPTWSTRNYFTKEPTEFTSLYLPKGMPFAFLCGACFSPGLEANLTAEMNNGQPLTFVPIKKNKNTQHTTKDDNTVCLISYGLTAPLLKGGKITCHFNRGKQASEEKLSFSLKKTSITEEEEEEETKEASNGIVRLQCPKVTTDKNVYVWFSSENEVSPVDEVPFLVPNLNKEIDFRPKQKEHHISCVVYDVKNPSVVRRKRYKVVTPDEEIKSGKWAIEENEQDAQTGSGTSKRGILIIAGLLIGGIGLTSILVCVSFGMCKFKRKRTEEVPKETQQEEGNRLSLLQSYPYNDKR